MWKKRNCQTAGEKSRNLSMGMFTEYNRPNAWLNRGDVHAGERRKGKMEKTSQEPCPMIRVRRDVGGQGPIKKDCGGEECTAITNEGKDRGKRKPSQT